MRSVFEGYEIRTPEIEALMGGKVAKVEPKGVDGGGEAARSQFLDKFGKTDAFGFALGENRKEPEAPKPAVVIEKPPSSFPSFKQKAQGGATHKTPVEQAPAPAPVQTSYQAYSMDVDLLGGGSMPIQDKPQQTRPEIDLPVKEASFAPQNLTNIPTEEFKAPKSKVLSLKSRIDKPTGGEDQSKKTNYFGAQATKKSANTKDFDDFFS